ncbi:PREDICTED: uncharacterized protein K02A2.6-like [Thamnophis sirtalis]|uniref:Gypsy retrotransposon integrase-like protein 1 n=1 Tax=Thamnophis sirtalis TaxID=35019 RepID=A0A6I9XW39_9SAUR|nr:PREDICTED: uncharacterized protein K02A2.6-like [Thamnophis sirtalis]
MEVDYGSSHSLLSWSTFPRLCPRVSHDQLQPVDTSLRDYQGTLIPTLDSFPIWVDYGDFHGRLPVLIVQKPLPALLGLDWFPPLGLSIGGIHRVGASSPSLDDVDLEEFADVFDGQLDSYKSTPISLNLDPQVAPIRLKARRVPFALRAKVDAELDKLLAQGILEPVDHSHWETPIVVPVKPNGLVRICADYKSTINLGLQANPYPVPIVQHLLYSLGRGCTFAKLDMAQAYQQFPVDDDAAAAQTIVTHCGAFCCHRLQFGVSVAPRIFQIFQSLMERLLHGLPGMVPYFNDVLIAASSRSELIEMLRKVLLHFRGAGLKLKHSKCSFAVPRVEFLGFLIDAQGIHPTPSKVAAIRNAPTPSSKAELQGLLNFYAPFVPHKASLVKPLHRLLDQSAAWHWGSREAHAFAAVKDMLMSAAVLVQYNDKLLLTLACDASPYGHTDALSRCPLPISDPAPVPSLSVLSIASLGLSLTAADVAAHTKADPVLAQVCSWVLRGWPLGKLADIFRPFKAREAKLSLHSGCLIWGDRVVNPSILRSQVLSLLHKNHPGIVRMKALACRYVWWPLLDAEIAAWVGRCSMCQLSHPPPAAPTCEWEAPRGPWSRLHIDFAGPFHGQTFLIVVDAYSRWVELVLMTSTSAESTERALHRLFATHGLPDVVVSDNGPQFASTTFQEFLALQDIWHGPTAPYHPACNGRAECAVHSAKEALGRMERGDWPVGLADGSEWRHHMDQLRKRLPTETGVQSDPWAHDTAACQPVQRFQFEAFPQAGLSYSNVAGFPPASSMPQSEFFCPDSHTWAFSQASQAPPIRTPPAGRRPHLNFKPIRPHFPVTTTVHHQLPPPGMVTPPK